MNFFIPATAGIQTTRVRSAWSPAFAGMTMVNVLRWKRTQLPATVMRSISTEPTVFEP